MTGFFALRDLGPSPIKGSRDPVRVFVLEGMGEARTRLDLSRARGLSKFVGRDRELSAITEALDRSRAGDEWMLALLLANYATAQAYRFGNVAKAVAYAREAHDVALKLDDLALSARTAQNLTVLLNSIGDAAESLRLADATLATLDGDLRVGAELTGLSPCLILLAGRTSSLRHLGRFADSLAAGQQAVSVAAPSGDVSGWTVCLALLAGTLSAMGDYDGAVDVAREAVAVSRRSTNPLLYMVAATGLGSCLLADGHAKEACELIANVIDRADSARTAQSFMPSWLSDLSLALLAEGELDRAAETAEHALQQALADGAPSRELESRIASAQIRLAAPADDPTFEDDVEEHLLLALELVEQMDFEELRPSLHELRAQLCAKRGDDAGRRRELAEAQRLYAAMGAPLRAEALARQLSA